MRIIKPNWVKHEHKGKPLSIFSIDLHPDGTRFATGGQGNDCGRVSIWNFGPIQSLEIENDENQPKHLAQIDSHLQCVNIVRWSQSGGYLASGGDDKLIMIWTLGARYQDQTEQYRSVSTLRSHHGDILDLNWSPDDRFLASCSIDNMIVIWNAKRWPEIVTILNGHHGLVKGVTWDPIGKYIASQSADKTLRVWRLSDWAQEACIQEPFTQCGDTTHVLRLDWSPDGRYLVSAQAMNGGGSVSKIIDRMDWSYDRDFVGHRKAIACVRFNKNIFKCPTMGAAKSKTTDANCKTSTPKCPTSATSKKSNEQEIDQEDNKDNGQTSKANENGRDHDASSVQSVSPPKPQCFCALGSRDRSLSIWSTSRTRPLVVIDDIVERSIIDISWSKCGYYLLACSLDGTVICLEFTKEELGQTYSSDERLQCLQHIYGTTATSIVDIDSKANRLIEDVDFLMVKQDKISNSNKDSKKANDPGHDAHKSDHNAQSEQDIGQTAQKSVPNNGQSGHLSGQQDNEKSDQNNAQESGSASNMKSESLVKPSNTAYVSRITSNTCQPGSRLAKGPTDKQIEIRSADGRRRIIPLFIAPSDNAVIKHNGEMGNKSDQQHGNTSSGTSISSATKPITFSSSSESKSKIVIETLDESNMSNISSAYNDKALSITSTNQKEKSLSESANQKQATMNISSSANQKQAIPINVTSKNEMANQKQSNEQSSSTIEPKQETSTNQKERSVNSIANQQHSNESDDDDEVIVLRKNKSPGIKRCKQNIIKDDPLTQAQHSQHTVQSPSIKRKPGRPPGTPTTSATLTNNNTAYEQSTPPITDDKLVYGKSVQQQQAPQIPNSVRVASALSESSGSGSIFFPPLRLTRQNHNSIKLFTKLDESTSQSKIFCASIEYPIPNCSLCKLSVMSNNEVCEWSTMLSSAILWICGSEQMVICYCEDHTIQVLRTDNGRRMHVPIVMESHVARMTCANKSLALIITCNAKVWLWDFILHKVLVRGESLIPILIDHGTAEQLSIQSASVSQTNKPIITISNGRTYVFDADLQSWCLINDINDPLNSCTDLKACAVQSIRQLSSYTKFPSRTLLHYYTSNPSQTQKSILSFLEKQLRVSEMLGLCDEYRYWIMNLVHHLVQSHTGECSKNNESRLREICTDLLGHRFPGKFANNKTNKTSSIPAEINKHDLLRDILTVLTSNLSLQRLYLEFKELIDGHSINKIDIKQHTNGDHIIRDEQHTNDVINTTHNTIERMNGERI